MRITSNMDTQRLGKHDHFSAGLSSLAAAIAAKAPTAQAKANATVAESLAAAAPPPPVDEGTVNNPNYSPVADDGSPAPVPAGTVNNYGTATWIPSGYPIPNQPYITTDGRLIVRPIRVPTTGVSQDAATAYLLAALQAAVTQFAPTVYNVDWSTSQGNGETVAASYFANPTDYWSNIARSSGGSVDPNWLNLPPLPTNTLADQVFKIGKALTMSTFVTMANGVVPGLGTQLTNYINGLTNANNATAAGQTAAASQTILANQAGSASNTNAAIQNALQNAQADQESTNASGLSNILSTDPSLLIIMAIVVIILFIWLS